jgi:hypothetical protein
MLSEMKDTPLINILIRNKYRPELFERCIKSIADQQYPLLNIFIACDSDAAHDHVETVLKPGLFSGMVTVHNIKIRAEGITGTHPWNHYCNTLKDKVQHGWFFYLDNDDYLRKGALDTLRLRISVYRESWGFIFQFMRNGRLKPNDRLMQEGRIQRGRIGGGCIVLHAACKNFATWRTEKGADYHFIADTAAAMKKRNLPLTFVPQVLQIAGNNGLHGK